MVPAQCDVAVCWLSGPWVQLVPFYFIGGVSAELLLPSSQIQVQNSPPGFYSPCMLSTLKYISRSGFLCLLPHISSVSPRVLPRSDPGVQFCSPSDIFHMQLSVSSPLYTLENPLECAFLQKYHLHWLQFGDIYAGKGLAEHPPGMEAAASPGPECTQCTPGWLFMLQPSCLCPPTYFSLPVVEELPTYSSCSAAC